MSKLKIYAIKDTKVGSMNPMFMLMENDEVAVRTFKVAINANNNSQICQFYEDMDLYRLGEFDDKTGEITSDVEYIISGPNVKIIKNEEKKEECNSEAN